MRTDLLIPSWLRRHDIHLANSVELAEHDMTPDARKEGRVEIERSDAIKGPGAVPGSVHRAHTANTNVSRRLSLSIPVNTNLDTRNAGNPDPHFHTGVIVDTITLLPSFVPGGWNIIADVQPLSWLFDSVSGNWGLTGAMSVQGGSTTPSRLAVPRGHYEVFYAAWKGTPNNAVQTIPIQFLLQNLGDTR